MIERSEVLLIPEGCDEGDSQVVLVTFKDGSWIMLSEKELRYAYELAEKGCFND